MLFSLQGALLTAVALFSVNGVALAPSAPKGLKFRGRTEQLEAQLEAAKRLRPPVQRRSEGGGPGTIQNITFTNTLASEFYVDGSTIPLVNWDAGPSWAGLLPISSDPDETRKLFFWFFPPGPEGSLDDLILWLNGGPGCSSMDGLLQENGPISWQPGEAYPTPNEYSWTNLSSILWIDQPVGTGYSVGTPSVTNEDEVAAQLVGFFQQFLEVFSELKGKNFYLSGESYAGMYVPYTANYIYENPTALDLNLKGFWISDPVITYDAIQSEVPAVNFMHKFQNVFALNQSFVDMLDSLAESCGYTSYLETYITYPPPPAPFPIPNYSDECDVWDAIYSAALTVNPGFDVYHVLNTWPLVWDVLGFPTQFVDIQVSPLYFNRQDVKAALHAPLDVEWTLCSNEAVFVNNEDTSLPPFVSIMPELIEKSERVVLVHGLVDFLLMSEGTRIAIQNMTWNGAQGFQTPIQNDTLEVPGFGALGTAHSERGLTYYEVQLSGHMIPEYAPWTAMHIMQYLMGFRDTL